MRLAASRSGRIWSWLIFAAIVAIGFGWFGGVSKILEANRLRVSTTHALGAITSISSDGSSKRATAYYEFTVDGQKRHGYSPISSQMASTLGPGKPVTVTYLADDPNATCLDPEAVAKRGRSGVLLAAILEAVLAAILLPLVITAKPDASIRQRALGEGISAAFAIGLMVLLGGSALIFGILPSYSKAKSLIEHGKTIQAEVTGVYDDENGRNRYAEYTYAVNGAYYHGKASYKGGYGDRGPIQISYLPEQPSFSARDPQQNLRDVRFGVLFIAGWLVMVLVIGSAIFFWHRARRTAIAAASSPPR